MTPNVRILRRRFVVALAVLAVVDVAAVVLLVSPVGAANPRRQAEFEAVRRLVQVKMHSVIPPDKVQERVEEAGEQIDDFYRRRLPAHASEISAELGKVAADSGVRLSQARYEGAESELPGLQHLSIRATLSGDYSQEARFINALERDPMFFIVRSISLAEQQGGGVRLQVTLETYLRQGT
jgi:type IV pilus assembly protein PilO